MKKSLVFLGSVLLATVPATAQAHTSLVSAVPANDSVVNTWPTELVLNFG